MSDAGRSRRNEPTFAELFTPKLISAWREGYGLGDFKADALAGITVAIVALPLSMAIAIASGAPPERGLYAAMVGGFLVSALGGSRHQIGGPAGAFIVLVAAVIGRHGFDGFMLATFLAGLILMVVGFLRLGTYVKYVPSPVIVGFTTGIGIIILASQVRDFLGLTLVGPEPAEILPKLEALAVALPTFNPATIAISVATVGLIVGIKKMLPNWPNLLIAVAAATLAVWLFQLPVETIGSRFGAVPRTLPFPALPAISLERIGAVLPDALAIAFLAGIESLLSAMVADGMTGRRHRSNCELVAQGAANAATAVFGGLAVTGTIARTATNIRAGARSPVAGMLHAIYVGLFLLVAAPLIERIPLSALAGVLTVVAWNMIETHAMAAIFRRSRADAVVLMATLGLTVFRDLMEGIAVGVVLGAFVFMHRMAEIVEVEEHAPFILRDRADKPGGSSDAFDRMAHADDVVVFRIAGAFFFGAAARVGAVLDRIGSRPRAIVLDLSAVPLVDATGADTLLSFARNAHRRGVAVVVAAAGPAPRRVLEEHGLASPLVRYVASVEEALAEQAFAAASA